MTLSLLLALVQTSSPAQAPTFDLAPMSSGLFKKLNGYRPLGIKLSDARPEAVKKAPEGALRFGTVKAAGRAYVLAIGGEKLYVDANGDGDLTNDPAPTWTQRTATDGAKAAYSGLFTLDIPIQGRTVAVEYGIYETGEADTLGAYADFALAGKVSLGGKSYDAIYSDPSGLWNGQGDLMIDKDGDGKFNPNYEFYRAAEPFNVAGTTYELRPVGRRLMVVKSSKRAAERTAANASLPDPNAGNGLKAGVAALPFEATTTTGKKVSFPKGYKGRLVLIDFWATWCGPCMREVPNVVKAYEAYRGKGFEVLGVSLDRPKALEQVKTVTARHGMAWEQIYDGGYFDAAIAKRYGIKAIPATYLVDGDTGRIVASGDAVRGERLAATVGKALQAKGGR